ncbi:DEAD/DEAH box helicase family protein [bacterium]|nr:DEAD/DEAH box helicase family protein [bacterium]
MPSNLKILEDIFSPAGSLAGIMQSYEERPAQVQMVREVFGVLDEGGSLLIEAGTGTGKSLAYLVPALLLASEDERVIIATHTIALQQQLLTSDVPLALEALGEERQVALLKGRRNYLCQRLLQRQQLAGLFADKREVERQRQLFDWAKDAQHGDRSELEFPLPDAEWYRVASSSDSCAGRSCPFYGDCFFQRARREALEAEVIITNHALLLSDLQLREEETAVLPDYASLIIDEAHRFEDSATSQFSASGSLIGLRRMVNDIYQPARKRGTLAYLVDGGRLDGEKLEERISELLLHGEDTFKALHEQLGYAQEREQKLIHKPLEVSPRLERELAALGNWLEEQTEGLEREEVTDLRGAKRSLDRLSKQLNGLFTQRWSGFVYWAEGLDEAQKMRLRAAPVEVGGLLSRSLWKLPESIIATSATLTVAGDFSYLRGRLEFPVGEEVKLPPVFDYQRQALVYLPDLPDPRDDDYHPKAVEELLRLIEQVELGGTLVLFTSYASLRAFHQELETPLKLRDFTVLAQGEVDRMFLLRQFKEAERGVLFATATFWEGVDLPGNQLRLLVITRLPFAVPTDPVVAARNQAIEERGGRAFFQYSVPEAALRLRQGFGRLIRQRSDSGVVALQDSRVRSKSFCWVLLYGLRGTGGRVELDADSLSGFQGSAL